MNIIHDSFDSLKINCKINAQYTHLQQHAAQYKVYSQKIYLHTAVTAVMPQCFNASVCPALGRPHTSSMFKQISFRSFRLQHARHLEHY